MRVSAYICSFWLASTLPAWAEEIVAPLTAPLTETTGEVAAAIPAAAEAHGASGGGLPQFDVSTYPSQIFWLFVAFVTLYILMSRVALPPIGKTIEERQSRRSGDLEKAERDRADAETIRLAYEQALAKAQEEARQLTVATENEIKAAAAKQHANFGENARKRLSEAEAKISKARTDALASITDIAADIAAEAFGKIVSGKASKDQARKSVEAALKGGDA